MSDVQSDQVDRAGRTPPYVSFKSFLSLIEELKTTGLPPQIDRSVLTRYSGGLGAQLVMAMKTLGVLTADNKPTPDGAKLVESFGSDEFKGLLRTALDRCYEPYLGSLDLMTATPAMFADAFKATGAKEDVLRKCRTFYLHAAQYVGIPLGPRLSGPVRSNGSAKRRPRAPSKAPRVDSPTPPAQQAPPPATESRSDKLLDKFPAFDPAWPDPIKEKWFAAYERILNMGETK